MRRYSSKAMAVSLALVLMIALATVLAPVTAQASGMGPRHGGPHMGHPMYNTGGSAYFNPNHLPRVIIHDKDNKQEWWGYVLHGGHYVRFYCPPRFGDGEQNYAPSVRALVAGPVAN